MKIYHMSPKLVRVELWESHALAPSQRCSVHTCRPNKGLTHRQRYEVIREWLGVRGLFPPPYSAFL